MSVLAEFYPKKSRWILIEMLCTSGLLSKESARHFTSRNPEKNSSNFFFNIQPHAAVLQITHSFANVLSKLALSFSMEPMHSVSFKSETRNIRSVLLNTFGRFGRERVDPSADGWMKQTFSIWLPQRLLLGLYCTHIIRLSTGK